jgi:hypothetical protein
MLLARDFESSAALKYFGRPNAAYVPTWSSGV